MEWLGWDVGERGDLEAVCKSIWFDLNLKASARRRVSVSASPPPSTTSSPSLSLSTPPERVVILRVIFMLRSRAGDACHWHKFPVARVVAAMGAGGRQGGSLCMTTWKGVVVVRSIHSSYSFCCVVTCVQACVLNVWLSYQFNSISRDVALLLLFSSVPCTVNTRVRDMLMLSIITAHATGQWPMQLIDINSGVCCRLKRILFAI